MEFSKFNYPKTWRRTADNIPKLSDDYGCYGAVGFAESSTRKDEDSSKQSDYEFKFKRISGKQNNSNYIATSTTLPLLHPDEDPGIPDVSIKDLFQNKVSKNKSQPIRVNRAAQQAAYFIREHPEIVYESSQTLLRGCFRTRNRKRKKPLYRKKYQKSFVPVVVGNFKTKRTYQLLGDVLCDIQPHLLQSLLHEEIESLAKKIINYPIYRGGCITYQQVNKDVGIIVSACGPPMDVLKIQPLSIKRTSRSTSSSTQQSVSPEVDTMATSQNVLPMSPPTSHASSQNVPLIPSTASSKTVPSASLPSTAHISTVISTASSSDDATRPATSKHGDVGYTLGTEKNPHLIALQGVIRQITSSRASTQETVYIGIRTDYHCHILTTEYKGDQITFRILHTAEFQYQLTYIALSPFIPGECVITLENGGVDLITSNAGVTPQIPPMFEGFAGSVWRQCHFGSHPRLLVSTEHKKVDLIDVKDTANLKATNLFQLPSNHLTQFEDILVAKQHPSNYFLHFVATDHQLFMFDERLPQTPILEWNHLLTTPPNCMDIFAPAVGDHVVVIATYASCEAHCFQFEVKESNPPSTVGSAWKIASVTGWLSLLPSLPSSSHALDAANKRLQKPFIGVSTIGHRSHRHPGFTVLITNSIGDVFYQTYISTNQQPALDKTLNVGPGCPAVELNKTTINKCYDWLDALTADYQKKPFDDGCLADVKEADALGVVQEMCLDVEPAPGCPFCCQEPIRTNYGHMTSSKCPACGLHPDVSFNHLEKYYTGDCVITRKSLGISDEEEVDDIIADDLHVKPGGPNEDDVGRTLWNLWKGPSADNENSQQSNLSTLNPRKVIRQDTTVGQQQEVHRKTGQPTSLPNKDTTDRPSQQPPSPQAEQNEMLSQALSQASSQDPHSQGPYSQESIDLFSQLDSQPLSQTVRKSERKRRKPAKLRGGMGF